MSQYLERPLTVPKNRRTLSNVEINAGKSRNTSGASLWAEDYFNADTEVTTIQGSNFETRLEGINYHPQQAGATTLTPPPAAATTSRSFPRSIPILPEEESVPPRQTRTHQRSLTALLPFLPPKTRSRENSKSPERALPIPSHIQTPKNERSKQEVDNEFMATLTGDRRGLIKVEEKRGGGLAGWFSGSSAPVAVGILTDDSESLHSVNMSISQNASSERRRSPTLQTPESNISTQPRTPAQQLSTSRIANFFSSRSTPSQQIIQLPTSTMQSDKLLTLDIQQALFPAGPQSPNDPFSPAAYKNLLQNAEGTLLKLQTAYKLRISALHELSLENAAREDELEEAETRNRALKSQLGDMAHQREEQDRVMAELVEELATEKQARAEEKVAREQSIREVRENRERMEREGKRGSCCAGAHGEEDLGVDLAGTRSTSTKKEWRRSHGSTTGEGESESDADSVFSRSISPTTTHYAGSETASTWTMDSSPEIMQASVGRIVPVQNIGGPRRPKMEKQPSTFQKILTGNTSRPQVEDKMGDGGCERCLGQDSSVAWDTVGLLKAENKGLKERVGDLEMAVDGALDLVAGLKF